MSTENVQIDGETEAKIRQAINDTDLSYDRATEIYQEAATEAQERGVSDLVDLGTATFPLFRGRLTTADVYEKHESVSVVTIGYGRRWDGYEDGDAGTIHGIGVAQPDGEPAELTSFVFSEDEVDVQEVRDAFEPLNAIEVQGISRSGADEAATGYVCYSTGQTSIEPSSVDMTTKEKSEFVNEHVGAAVSMDEVTANLSHGGQQVKFNERPLGVKRIVGTIVDSFVNGEVFTYSILGDDVVDPRELDEDITGEGRRPGMTCWIDDPDMMEFGENSLCEFYGNISQNDEGQVSMNTYGIVPHVPNYEDAPNTDVEPDESSSGDVAHEEMI